MRKLHSIHLYVHALTHSVEREMNQFLMNANYHNWSVSHRKEQLKK